MMNSREIRNHLYERAGWTNGPTTRELELLTTMDFFSQNVLLSGGSGTGKSTTTCIGLAANFLSRRANGDNVVDNDENGNAGDESRPGSNGDDQYKDVHADAGQLSFRFTPRNSDHRNQGSNGVLADRPNASNNDTAIRTESSRDIISFNPNEMNNNQRNREVNVPLLFRVTGNNANIFNQYGSFRAPHPFNHTRINIYLGNDNYNNLTGSPRDIIPFNPNEMTSNQGNHEVNAPEVVRPSNTNGDVTNQSETSRMLVLYNSNGMNIFHRPSESNETSTTGDDVNHRVKANRLGSSNADHTFKEEDMKSYDSYQTDSDSEEDIKCGNQRGSEITYRNGKAFAFVVTYKTVTCNEIAACLRYLVPQMNVVAITGAANWATNYEDICRADALIITFDHLEFFYRTSWTVYFPALKFYIVEEAVSMSHRRQIDSLEYFLDNYVDRRAIQIIIISRIISSADASMYRQLVGNLYTRCDLTRNNGVHGNNQDQIPNILRGEFRG